MATSILLSNYDVLLTNVNDSSASLFLPSSTSTIISSSAATSSTTPSSKSSTMATAAVIPIPFRQYNTANDIPTSYYKENKIIRGRVIKIVDGDTIRLRHTPLYPLKKGRDCTRRLSECTISVRLYAVDAPETAKRGSPGQPFAQEATEYTTNQVLDKVVRVKILRKDQYARVVGQVTTRNRMLPFLTKDLSVSLAEKGLASLYTGGGAEYDGNRQLLEKKIEKARQRRQGIWSGKEGDFVDPAEYKRNVKAKDGK